MIPSILSSSNDLSRRVGSCLPAENWTTTRNVTDPSTVMVNTMGAGYLALIALAIVLTNVSYLGLIILNRKAINWSSGIFQMSLSVSDLFSGLLGLAMASYWFSHRELPTSKYLSVLFESELTGTVNMTVLSHLSLFSVQYIAIKKPMLYKVKFTKRVRLIWISVIWVFNAVYIFAKIFVLYYGGKYAEVTYSKWEAFAFGLSIIVCTFAYGNVLYIAYARQKQLLKHRQQSWANFVVSSSQLPEPQWVTGQNGKSRTKQKSIFKEYFAVSTAGLHLIVYLITFVPLFVSWVFVVSNNESIYCCHSFYCATIFYLWLSRGFIDPLIQIGRNPKLRIRKIEFCMKIEKLVSHHAVFPAKSRSLTVSSELRPSRQTQG